MSDLDIYCNKCGIKLDDADIYQAFHVASEIGYGSKYDKRNLSLWLCNDCMDKLIDSCKISPIVDELYPFDADDTET